MQTKLDSRFIAKIPEQQAITWKWGFSSDQIQIQGSFDALSGGGCAIHSIADYLSLVGDKDRLRVLRFWLSLRKFRQTRHVRQLDHFVRLGGGCVRTLSIRVGYGDGTDFLNGIFFFSRSANGGQSPSQVAGRVDIDHLGRSSLMGDIMAEISHEVLQPIYSIRNFAAACKKKLSEPDSESEVARNLDRIQAAVSNAADIIHGLNAFGKPDCSKRESQDFSPIVDDAILLVNSHAMAGGHEVRNEVPPGRQFIQANRVQVFQVIANLLRNALEAAQRQGMACRTICVRAGAEGGFLHARVDDNGPGLDGQPNIFDSFVTAKPEGMGLGLAISARIVHAHGGTMWASQNSSGGASIHLVLPMAFQSGPI